MTGKIDQLWTIMYIKYEGKEVLHIQHHFFNIPPKQQHIVLVVLLSHFVTDSLG
jgi:hypothetical protein